MPDHYILGGGEFILLLQQVKLVKHLVYLLVGLASEQPYGFDWSSVVGVILHESLCEHFVCVVFLSISDMTWNGDI